MFKVSVLMATYNMSNFIFESVDSCLNNLGDPEVIVVDDGSNDGTYEMLINKYKDDIRVKIYRFYENKGKVVAFNKAYEISTAPNITLLGADDILLPGREKLVREIEKHTEPRLYIGSYLQVDRDLIYKRRIKVRKSAWSKIVKKNYYPGGTMVFNRTLANIVFPINPDINNEDYFIALVACFHNADSVINEDVLIYRRHQNNTWRTTSNLEAFVKTANRNVLILNSFRQKFNLNHLDYNLVDFSIKVNKNLGEWNLNRAIYLLPMMLFYQYAFIDILRMIISPKLYFLIRDSIVK